MEKPTEKSHLGLSIHHLPQADLLADARKSFAAHGRGQIIDSTREFECSRTKTEAQVERLAFGDSTSRAHSDDSNPAQRHSFPQLSRSPTHQNPDSPKPCGFEKIGGWLMLALTLSQQVTAAIRTEMTPRRRSK